MASEACFVPVNKPVPGTCLSSEDLFNFPFVIHQETVNFITKHGRIMFIIRGPSGTSKNILSSLLIEKYPKAVFYSANQYFEDSFEKVRNRETTTESHKYCHRKTENACRTGNHPIIIQNTHIRKREMLEYLEFAAQYNYTIIMAITVRKFKITPQILEKTNRKGLNRTYLSRRLDQWREVLPLLTGWFICPDDVLFLHSNVKCIYSKVVEDKRVLEILNIPKKENLQARKTLYCLATLFNQDLTVTREMRQHYLSRDVQDNYGKCNRISIGTYIIAKSDIFAVVDVAEMDHLIFTQENASAATADSLEDEVSRMNLSHYQGTISLESSSKKKTAKFIDWEDDEKWFSSRCSFIHIVLDPDECSDIETNRRWFSDLIYKANVDEAALLDVDNIKVVKLCEGTCLVKLPKKIELDTVFTGLYI